MKQYSSLTKEQFKDKLVKYDMTQNDFSELTGCAYITVKKWKDYKIPLWVDYIFNYLEIKSIANTLSSSKS